MSAAAAEAHDHLSLVCGICEEVPEIDVSVPEPSESQPVRAGR
jgi:hypothetical protein